MKKITLNVVEVVEAGAHSYSSRESYPAGPGLYLFFELAGEDKDSWCGIAVVGEGSYDVTTELVAHSGSISGVYEKLKELVKEEVEQKDEVIQPGSVVPEIRVMRNEYGEPCRHSFNDILRTLAAAVGKLPEEVSHDRRI